MTTNQTVLDLSKVQHGTFWWVNQYGHKRRIKPKYSYLGDNIAVETVPNHRLKDLDVWSELVEFQLTANHYIKYTGAKAVSMYAAWREWIFNQKKGK